MTITLTKNAAKNIIIAMENAGLDVEQFAVSLGMEKDAITLGFVRLSDQLIMYRDQFGLKVIEEVDFGHLTIDLARLDNRDGLVFLDAE